MKKRVLSIIVSCLMVVCNMNFVFAADTSTKQITIVHTNDTHSRILDTDGGFGFAKISTIIKQQKQKNPNTLVLDAGDTLHGMPIVNVSRGENAIKILDAVGYDFMTLGNHDFNYGYQRTLELGQNSKVKMLNANIVDESGKNIFTPYEIVEKDGIKIAIFGLATPETAYKTSPKNVEGLTFKDPIEVSKDMVEQLKDKADIVIALAHVGLDESSVITSKKIAESVEGIDIIIDGHSHTQLPEGLLVNDTLIAQTGEYDKNLGIVNIELEDGKITKKEATLLSAETSESVELDSSIVGVIEDIQKQNEPIFSEVVAKTDIDLDGEREHVRRQETNLGNLSADAARVATGADIAFVNGGGIRTSIPAGDITKGKIAELFPFGNTIHVKKITGSDLVKVLENSVSGYPETQGAFLQVSGVTFSFEESKEAGTRVTDVMVGGNNLDESAEYTVAINDFMAIGGDGYDVFKNYTTIAEFGTYEEIFANYLKENGTQGCEVSGRINVISQSSSEPIAEAEVAPIPEAVAEAEVVPAVEVAPASVLVAEEEKSTPNNSNVYIVKAGDNLTKIAKIYGITWRDISNVNNLSNPNLIFPGQELKIPDKAA